MRIDNYTLGIIWGIGSYQEDRFVFRHKAKHFLEQIQKYCNNETYSQVGTSGKTQLVLKTSAFSTGDFPGWTERNSDQRDVPVLDDYKDFLRAYFELHSCLDYCTAYYYYGRKVPEKYKKLRLRVYGNRVLIESINNILAQECRVKIKSVQDVKLNNKTSYLQYTALGEIPDIYNWLSGNPSHEPFWEDVDKKLRVPIIRNV